VSQDLLHHVKGKSQTTQNVEKKREKREEEGDAYGSLLFFLLCLQLPPVPLFAKTMKVRSCKAKGMRFQRELARMICTALRLPAEDVRSTSCGANGADLCLSAAARAVFPFAVEAKNVERPNAVAAYAQAEHHARGTGLIPMAVFRANRCSPVAVLHWKDGEDIMFFREAEVNFAGPEYTSFTRALKHCRDEKSIVRYNTAGRHDFMLVPFHLVLERCECEAQV
jgi:hypothetical protein